MEPCQAHAHPCILIHSRVRFQIYHTTKKRIPGMKQLIVFLSAFGLLLSACQANVTVQPKPSPTPNATPTPQPSPTASADPTLTLNANFDALPSGTAGENENSAM